MKRSELFIAVPILNSLSLLFLTYGRNIEMGFGQQDWVFLFPFLTYMMVPVIIIMVLKHFKQDNSLVYTMGALLALLLVNKFISAMLRKSIDESYYTILQALSLGFFIIDMLATYQAQQLTNATLKTWLTVYFSVSLAMSIANRLLPELLSLSVVDTQMVYLALPIISNIVFLLFILKLPNLTIADELEVQGPDDLLSKKDTE